MCHRVSSCQQSSLISCQNISFFFLNLLEHYVTTIIYMLCLQGLSFVRTPLAYTVKEIHLQTLSSLARYFVVCSLQCYQYVQ